MACLVAWGIAYLAAFSVVGSGNVMEWGWRAVTVLLAPAMTAALIAGWEGLERGF
ncbi:MAG TPA: hypothetical protein VFB21_08285 [Chthonomonadaceae bacterium]|nr:hypothetical protein [Chthonomonadaceae bacterium]